MLTKRRWYLGPAKIEGTLTCAYRLGIVMPSVIRGKENRNENCFRSCPPDDLLQGFFRKHGSLRQIGGNLRTSSCARSYRTTIQQNNINCLPIFPLIGNMSSIIGRSAFRASRPLKSAFQSTRPRWQEARTAASQDREAGREALRKGARRDPELYVRLKLLHKVSKAHSV